MRLFMAIVSAWAVALGLTCAVFSSPSLATVIAENDMLLVVWFILTIGCAMSVFAWVIQPPREQ